ncbi:EGF-like and EMI domain-containing protein 1 [Notamacropus eugenii]|uniref:EGF-like and EMI domain-containing protein 1 n=1 Tax=Notamacropus eugenii TaxID=9315 RepID=UPI003B683B7B
MITLKRPNVCEEVLDMVGLPQPCVQPFTRTVKLWKQGCAGSRWCMGYVRRTGYYIVYRQVYRRQHQTVYRCCPGWSQHEDEPGCLHALCSVGPCFNGGQCPDGEAQVCQCSAGFQGPRCQYDVNECAIDNGGCQDQCCNTIGSYYCKCQAGQKLKEDGKGCKDVDECAVVNGGCQQSCINTEGSFYCECDMGYRLHADGRTCIMKDPCSGGHRGCSHICLNDRGIARCACHPGYHLSADKMSCTDIDECTEGNTHCAHHCVNSMGSFTCTCNPGFELGADGRHCYRIEMEIVNSCEQNNGGCSHHCEHSTGGPRCSCNHGHRLDVDGKTCKDLDECESGQACCSQFCINYLGGYECDCKTGFQLSPDGCGCDALDDDEVEEEEEELEVVRFSDLHFRKSAQLLNYAVALNPSYEDEDELEERDNRGEFTVLHKVVCLDDTFGADCSLRCEDCMNGGKCNEEKSHCLCPAGWGGILCSETCPPGTYGQECNGICQCQNGGSCDPVTGHCHCPPGVHGMICEDGCPKGFFGKDCKKKCMCAHNSYCHKIYGVCLCDPGLYGRFCHLTCPKGAYGAGCSSECQCMEENTLECNAKNGSCTCKSGYQGNRCQEGIIR